jgi:glycosyltransferase involved in cell wall biosynthesis
MPTKPRIAFVANTSWGIYKFRLYLIKQLIANGFTIYVLAPRDKYTPLFNTLPGLTYIELKKFRGKSLSPFRDMQLYRELLGHYRQIRPSLIFHYTIKANIFGSIAASRIKCPSVSVITGLGYTFSTNKLLRAIAKFLYRMALKKSREVWFLNSDDQSVFLNEGLIRKENTFLLPGEGVDTEAFYPAPYGQADRPVTFLLVGRIIRHKGIYEFIQAAELLRARGIDPQFQLLGFFDEDNPVSISRQQVDEWSSQRSVTYLGQTDNVAPFIEKADCVVLPSYREGMPLSLLEGASMCKALIASNTSGCREVVNDGLNGYLARNKDAKDLADKMEKYFRLSPEEKRQMGLKGREKVIASFTQEIVTGIYLNKLNALI